MTTRFVIAGLLALLVTATANASVECLSGKVAQQAVADDSAEPYFSLLQPREMVAKAGMALTAGKLAGQREQVRRVYRDAVLDCSAEELQGLKGYLSIIDSHVATKYPGLVALPWRFVKIRNGIEGGLPHTRGDVIVLPEKMLRVINETALMEQWRADIMTILLHEQVHVLQRAKPQLFASLYQQWGFRKAVSIRGAEGWLAKHQILDPDAIDVQWVWPVPGTTRVLWPRVILDGESRQPAMPRDLRMVGIELTSVAGGYTVVTDKQGVPLYHPLKEEGAYMERFSAATSLFHPNEIAADYLAGLAMWDTVVDRSTVPAEQQSEVDEAFKTLRPWARQNLAK